MENDLIFPIHRLGLNVTDVLTRMLTSGLADSVAKNLDNQIDYIELGGPINIVSSILKNPITGKSHVSLSAAFFQFLWIISNISIRTLDAIILNEQINKMSPHERELFYRSLDSHEPDIESIKEIIDTDSVFKQTHEEFNLALELRHKEYDKNTVHVFNDLPYSTQYGLKTNNICRYGIAYILLHEHAHYILGHMETIEIDIAQESEADYVAFWDMYTDVEPNEKVTANIGVLNALFCLILLNPTFESDKEHPQEYLRFIKVYEMIKDDNYKYAIVVVHLFKIWAFHLKLLDFPIVSYNDEGVQQIKEYIESKLSQLRKL